MIIGIDLGGTNIRAGIEEGGKIINPKKEVFKTKRSLNETLSQLTEFIRPMMQPGVKGIGIGVPSVVDVEKGIVFNAVSIPTWVRVPLKDILEGEFEIPVSVNNDVNCFVLGEHRFGLLQGFKNVVGISCGTGLGAGIIVNNHLFNGHNCGAGEIGLLDYRDHNIEHYASGNLFRTYYDITAEEAHNLALKGDEAAIGYWNEFGVHLAAALKSAVYAYDPQAIVLGGSLAKAYNLFKASMHNSLLDFAFPESIKRLKIFQSQNEHITLLGASALIQQEVSIPVKEA